MEDDVTKLLRETKEIQAVAAKVSGEADRLVELGQKKLREGDEVRAGQKQVAESFRNLVNTKGLPPGSSVKCFTMAVAYAGGIAEAEGIATEGLRAANIPEPGIGRATAKRRPGAGRMSV